MRVGLKSFCMDQMVFKGDNQVEGIWKTVKVQQTLSNENDRSLHDGEMDLNLFPDLVLLKSNVPNQNYQEKLMITASLKADPGRRNESRWNSIWLIFEAYFWPWVGQIKLNRPSILLLVWVSQLVMTHLVPGMQASKFEQASVLGPCLVNSTDKQR